MNAEIEEIKRQLHDLRNYLGPVELLHASMEAQSKKDRAEQERRIAALESRLDDLAKRVDSRDGQLSDTPPCPTRLVPDAPPGVSA